MKKLVKAAACMMLATMLLMTACSGRNNDDGNGNQAGAATGRYVEVEITPPISGRFISLVSPDGNLAVFDTGLQTRYDSSDGGETWVQSPGPGAESDRFTGVQTAAFLPDGRLLVFERGAGMMALSPEDNGEHFPIYEIDNAIADDENVSVSLIQMLDDGNLMLTYTIGGFDFSAMEFTQIIGGDDEDLSDSDSDESEDGSTDETEETEAVGRVVEQNVEVRHRGSSVRTHEVTVTAEHSGGRITMDGGNIIFGGAAQTTAIHCIATGERISELTVPTPLGANSHGDVYFMQGHSLLRHDHNGYVDTLLDGTAFAFGAPTSSAAAVQSLAGGGFIVNVLAFGQEGQYNRLFRYSWDANATIDSSKTITIWSLEDNALVRAAITEIWRLHPDACITYEIALATEGAISAADAIRTLNTRLLSGRGPDILILDGTPIDSYANRGMLLDLSGRINTAAMYQNLLAPYYENGQLYVIPTQFSIPALKGSGQRLSQLQTLAALVESVVNGNPPAAAGFGDRMLGGIPEKERPELHFNDLQELFEIMWQANAPAFIADNRLDSDALKEFLAAIKAISDIYDLGGDNNMDQGWVAFGTVVAIGGGGAPRVSMVAGSLMQFMAQTTNLAAFSIDSLTLLQMTMGQDAEIATFPGLTPGTWRPSTIVGVSADTEVPVFAAEFVNTLLSIDVQVTSGHGDGLPITREAIQQQINTINELMAEFDMGTFDIDMDALVSQLKTPSIIETALQEMIWETVERLCTGRVDLEGAVGEIEQNIRNYLAERS